MTQNLGRMNKDLELLHISVPYQDIFFESRRWCRLELRAPLSIPFGSHAYGDIAQKTVTQG